MTDIATTYRPELTESPEKLVNSTQPSSEALITEQQVLFSTAAAVALPPAKIRALGAFGSWLANAARPPKPLYPKRRPWLENAAMSRAMDRL
jgi:hypothetical protein